MKKDEVVYEIETRDYSSNKVIDFDKINNELMIELINIHGSIENFIRFYIQSAKGHFERNTLEVHVRKYEVVNTMEYRFTNLTYHSLNNNK
jgi:hypothetical protein